MPIRVPIRPKLVLVTFDLNNPVPGDRRYRTADRLLGSIGTVIKPFKQTRLVITTATLASIRRTLRGVMGRRGNLGVLRISRRSAVEIADPGVNAAMRLALSRHGSA
ncbi:MAG: hypothetical protein M3Y22_07660 [Pseudomonadota bacterium]|nr:hypothetical protein [Pseudomonadota bacterium]